LSKVYLFKTQEKLCVLGVLCGEKIQINPLHEGQEHEEHKGRIERDVRSGFLRTHQEGPTMSA